MSSDISKGPATDRLPRNHQTILDAIRDAVSGTHLTAQDVHLRARQRQPKIGFATVHRGLARLVELGYVAKVDVPGAASAVYEGEASSHAHFRCNACGNIQDVPFTVAPELLGALAARHGVQIDGASTTFFGRCANCAVV